MNPYTPSGISPLRSRCLLLAILAICLSSSALVAQQKPPANPSQKERLATLEKLMEEQRVQHKIPGMALAVVIDGKVVLAKGFGLRDMESKKPVEADTIFAIGSSTKAFTGALIAGLVDEGKMDWDDPVTKFMPEFKLDIDTGDEGITIRDLLSHRTGFSRMGVLYGGDLNRDEVLEHAVRAKPIAKFREKCIYTNVMYTLAGVCAGKAADSDWDTQIRERIFSPLGMIHSSTTYQQMVENPNRSLGYSWNKDWEKHDLIPFMNLDSIGPAGSINSNVNDMSQWLKMQLEQGTIDETQVVSKTQLDETWKKQIEFTPGVDYGIGWMLHEWEGKQVVEHGGNVGGFSAQVAMLPEEKTGFVLLINTSASPLQALSTNMVFETLLGEPVKEGSLAGIDLDSLTGKYVANVAQFQDSIMEVKKMDGGKIGLDVPGQMLYELKAPDEEGKWYFAATNTIAISFNKGADDEVNSISLHQHGDSSEFPRQSDDSAEPRLDIAEVESLVGTYFSEKDDFEIELTHEDGRLLAKTGDYLYTFVPPQSGDKWTSRPDPKRFQIQFKKGDDSKVESMTFYQPGPSVVLKRTGDATNSPSVKEIIEKIKQSHGSWGDDISGVKMNGSVDMIHQGVKGKVAITVSKTGQHLTQTDLGRMGKVEIGFDGEDGASYYAGAISKRDQHKGKGLKRVRLTYPLLVVDQWSELFEEIRMTGTGELDGQKTWVLTLKVDDEAKQKLHVSAETGLILKYESAEFASGITIPTTTTYSDYRPVGGFQFPFKSTSENSFMGKTMTEITAAETVTEFPTGAFEVGQDQ